MVLSKMQIKDPLQIADFFKSKSYHVGIITTPRGAAYPWVTGPSFMDVSNKAYKDNVNAWLKAFQMASVIVEAEIPDAIVAPVIVAVVDTVDGLPVITKDDVYNKALQLGGELTNLEIKNSLREDGFYATQKMVADFMDQLSQDCGWPFDFNGEFRTYNISGDINDSTSQVATPATQTQTSNFFRSNSQTPNKFDTRKIGDWVCRDANNMRRKHETYTNTSWLQAKKQYAKTYGINYFDVRIKRNK